MRVSIWGLSLLLAVGGLVIPGIDLQVPFSLLAQSNPLVSRTNFSLWVEQQRAVSFEGFLANIGGPGGLAGVATGAVIASPSKTSPDYFYQWIRDGALTIDSLVSHLEDEPRLLEDLSPWLLRNKVELYLVHSRVLQRTPNPSGNFSTLAGLGEPKFHSNGSAFTGTWGRPQRDGPALRVLTVVHYLLMLKDHGLEPRHTALATAHAVFTLLVQPDLEYLMRVWRHPSFDLWEEIHSTHFFTSLNQLAAMKEGAVLARRFNEAALAHRLVQELELLERYLTTAAGFTLPGVMHIIQTPSLYSSGERGGLDAATLLGVLSTRSLQVEIPFDVDDPRVLSTLALMVLDMRERYPINRQGPARSLAAEGGAPRGATGVGLGRYPEDVYDGVGFGTGNPWFLTTASAAEVVYRLVVKLTRTRTKVVIDETNRAFYGLFGVDGVLEADSAGLRTLLHRLVDYADSFLEVIQRHTDAYGHMSEQFNRHDGFMTGAQDLTWSYSALWNSVRWRDQAVRAVRWV